MIMYDLLLFTYNCSHFIYFCLLSQVCSNISSDLVSCGITTEHLSNDLQREDNIMSVTPLSEQLDSRTFAVKVCKMILLEKLKVVPMTTCAPNVNYLVNSYSIILWNL